MFVNVKRSAVNMSKVYVIVVCGILTALGIVLRSAAIPITPTNRLTLTFIAIAAAGYLLGSVPAAVVGMLIDILGYIVNPMGAAFFPGFTISSAITGFVYGLLLYRRPLKTIIFWIVGAQLAVTLGVHVVLNTIWLSVMYEKAYAIFSSARIIKNAVLFVPYTAIIFAVVAILDKAKISARIWRV